MKNYLKILIYTSFIFCISLISCNKRYDVSIQSLMRILSKNDKKLEKPIEGDWLYTRKEKGQTFNQYIKNSPLSVTPDRNVIYLQPIGNFDSLHYNLIRYTKDYLQIFYQLNVTILNTLPNNIIPDSAKRTIDGNEQIYAPYILNDLLIKRIPKDAIVIMVLTERDLYPNPTWNYVFGLASYKRRVGVTSMFRFCNYDIDTTNYQIGLKRLINVSSHEIGHMFTMKHCVNAVCTMNGSNNLSETDTKPNRLCSECTAKLAWNLNFNPYNRAIELQNFFLRHKMKEDFQKTKKDVHLMEKYGVCSFQYNKD